MKEVKLDQEEQAILDAFEADEFESVLGEKRIAYLAQAAEEMLKKDSSD